jgi:hypothetical protein
VWASVAEVQFRHAERAGALKLLDDPLAATATQEIVAGSRSRWEIQRAIKVSALHVRHMTAVWKPSSRSQLMVLGRRPNIDSMLTWSLS